MDVYGLDFTSSPRKPKPLTLAVCRLDGGVLRVRERRPLPGSKGTPFGDFEAFLRTPGPWIAGIDFPFGQPRKLVDELGWPREWSGYVSHGVGMGKKGFEDALRGYKASKPKGEKELSRETDTKAASRSPMKLENPPVAKMFFEGAARLLHSDASILPVRPRVEEDRIVVEAYPALVARKWIGKRQGYKNDDKKKCDDEMLFARCDIVHAVRGEPKNGCRKSVEDRYGLVVEMSDEDAEACIADYSGDQLDSILCAIQAAWSYKRRDAGFGISPSVDPTEGWIVDPEIL